MPTATHPDRTADAFRFMVSIAIAGLLAMPTASSAYDVSLAWDRVDDATGYHVFIRYNQDTLVDTTNGEGTELTGEAGGFGYSGHRPIATTMVERPLTLPAVQAGADGLILYTVSGLPLGPTVFFAVSAFDADNESLHSNELFITYADAAQVVDSDGDGLVDAAEDTNLNGVLDDGETDARNDDTDGDGLNDGDEIVLNGTDPLDADSDDDGTLDLFDSCHDVDGDGFGAWGLLEPTCALDNCVLVANPDQLDTDLDGLGQPCDPCTNVAGGQDIRLKTQIVLKRVANDPVPGNDSLSIKGDFLLPPGSSFASLDPGQLGARVVINGADGGSRVDIAVPPGAFVSGRHGHGWRVDRARKNWKYLDKRKATVGGITKVLFKDLSRRDPRLVRLLVKGKRGIYPIRTTDNPVQAVVVLGGATASMAGQCGETRFERNDCDFNGRGRVLACRL